MARHRGAKPRSARLLFQRALKARWSPSLSTLKGRRSLNRIPRPPTVGAALSSPLLAGCFGSRLAVGPSLALVTSDPDVESFMAGVQTAIYVAVLVVATFTIVGFIRKKLGE